MITELRQQLKCSLRFILGIIKENSELPQISKSDYYYVIKHLNDEDTDAETKQFISDVVGIPMEQIKAVKVVSPFLRKRSKEQKLGIMDLSLTLNDDTKIDIELQLRSQKFWVKRNLFYLAHLYVDELWVGENYEIDIKNTLYLNDIVQ